MSAIEVIRERKPKADGYQHKTAWDGRICLMADAILELADSLHLLEAEVCKLAGKTEAKGEPYPVSGTYKGKRGEFHVIEQRLDALRDEPFRVTSPGKYETDHGQTVKLLANPENISWPWTDTHPDHNGTRYGGSFWNDSGIPFGGNVVKGRIVYGPLPVGEPEPKRITGWMNIWRLPNGDIRTGQVIWSDRDKADIDHAPDWKRIACIRVGFIRGEGIEQERC